MGRRCPPTGAVRRRQATDAADQVFEYEVFAYGGIDVNRALGSHAHEDQYEVAFPGGIRTEMIRSAREYNKRKVVRIWRNMRFDHEINPRPYSSCPCTPSRILHSVSRPNPELPTHQSSLKGL